MTTEVGSTFLTCNVMAIDVPLVVHVKTGSSYWREGSRNGGGSVVDGSISVDNDAMSSAVIGSFKYETQILLIKRKMKLRNGFLFYDNFFTEIL